MVTRQELHTLLDEIPDQGLPDIHRYLGALKQAGGDPFLAHLLLAPEDDEPITPEEEAALAEAREDVAAGRVYRIEQVRRDLGL